MSALSSGLSRHIFARWTLLLLVTLAMAGVTLEKRMEEEVRADHELRLRAASLLLRELARPLLSGAPDAALSGRLRALAAEAGMRITVIDVGGVVRADSAEDAARMDDHRNRPEILAARETGTGTATRYSHTVRAPLMYVAVPVRNGDRLLGYARTAVPLDLVDRQREHLQRVMISSMLAALAVALVLGAMVAQRISGPLRGMTQAAQRMAGGQLDVHVEEAGPGEVGVLARAFNAMGADLRSRIEAVTRDRNQVIAILESMVEGVIAVDARGVVIQVNPVAARLLDLDPGTMVGRVFWERLRIPDLERILSQTLQQGTRETSTLQLGSGARSARLEVRTAPLEDRAGAVVVLHDVTELRRLEVVRQDFVANVSHELKTPLTAITGLVETLIDAPDMEAAKKADYLGRMREQARRLGTLVTDLLALGRIESPHALLEFAPVDLAALAGECARTFVPLALEKGLSLDLAVPDAPLIVAAEEEALRQAIQNLVDNAVKYTPAGGTVAVRVSTEERWARLDVVDSGIGIATEHQDRIFERFYRVERGRSKQIEGTGLGLSIVRHTVNALRGTVSVTSAAGSGSTFTVRLPLYSL